MKVCTDSCIFGATVAKNLGKNEHQNLLDIGTGTGLLSLMIAQQSKEVVIDAIEIETEAANQAKENIENSNFKNQITVYQSSLQAFNSGHKYSTIVSNPPFFENELKSSNQLKNIALHTELLPHENLLSKTALLLDLQGKFWVLLPYHYKQSFVEKASKKGFYLNRMIDIKTNEKKDFFRCILELSFTPSNLIKKEFVIKTNDNTYSLGMIELMSDYYLFLK